MTKRIQRCELQVSEELYKLITEKVCVNIDLEPDQFGTRSMLSLKNST